MKSFIRETDFLPIVPHGWGNGYIVIPEGHPAYEKDYDDIDVDIHGGLTFAEHTKNLNWDEIGDADGWVIGFDTAHYQDTSENWPKERVLKETLNLKKQLEEMIT